MASEIWEWITPDGASYRLDSGVDGVQVVEEVDGRGMPPIRDTREIVPLQPGSRKRSVIFDENEVTVGLLFTATSATGLRALTRSWIGRLDPTRGDGVLAVTGPDGATRQVACTYSDGMRLAEVAGDRTIQQAVVTWRASDPFWADIDDSTQAWSVGGSATFFTTPFFPLRLGASESFGAATITNLGDVDTFPAWVVAGPIAQLTLTNVTTGRSLLFEGTLGASEFMVIDGRPGTQTVSPKSVLKNDGSNLFGSLQFPWDFWPLVPGAQSVNVEIAGADSGTQVTAVWRNRYLSA